MTWNLFSYANLCRQIMTCMTVRLTFAAPTAIQLINFSGNTCNTDHRVRVVPATAKDAVRQHWQQC